MQGIVGNLQALIAKDEQRMYRFIHYIFKVTKKGLHVNQHGEFHYSNLNRTAVKVYCRLVDKISTILYNWSDVCHTLEKVTFLSFFLPQSYRSTMANKTEWKNIDISIFKRLSASLFQHTSKIQEISNLIYRDHEQTFFFFLKKERKCKLLP